MVSLLLWVLPFSQRHSCWLVGLVAFEYLFFLVSHTSICDAFDCLIVVQAIGRALKTHVYCGDNDE